MRGKKGWGNIDPILAHTDADGVRYIVDGHHRIEAAKRAGIDSVNWVEATPEQLRRIWGW